MAMRINPHKMINKEHPMEKWVVRKALKICCPQVWFETKKSNLVMEWVWIDKLKEVVAVEVTDEH
jgi:asparagine synthase (glutamine-hydrolysing)